MSLKAFHIVFILAAVALSFGFGLWSARMEQAVAVRAASYAISAGLLAYLVWFVRKLSK